MNMSMRTKVSLFGKDCWSMQEMRAKGELLDMVFVCNDGTIVKAHRLLMAASSLLLRALIAQHNTQVSNCLHLVYVTAACMM